MRKVRFLLSSLDLLKKKSLKDVPLMAPEFPSLVGGFDVCFREIESIHRIYAKCLAEDNLRANLVEEICTVEKLKKFHVCLRNGAVSLVELKRSLFETKIKTK